MAMIMPIMPMAATAATPIPIFAAVGRPPERWELLLIWVAVPLPLSDVPLPAEPLPPCWDELSEELPDEVPAWVPDSVPVPVLVTGFRPVPDEASVPEEDDVPLPAELWVPEDV